MEKYTIRFTHNFGIPLRGNEQAVNRIVVEQEVSGPVPREGHETLKFSLRELEDLARIYNVSFFYNKPAIDGDNRIQFDVLHVSHEVSLAERTSRYIVEVTQTPERPPQV